MIKGKFLRNQRLLGALALTILVAALITAHLQGGVSMELGEMMLSVQPHQEGGLMVSVVKVP